MFCFVDSFLGIRRLHILCVFLMADYCLFFNTMSRRLHHSKSNQSTQGRVVKPDVYGLRRQKIKRAIASFEQDDDDEFPMDEGELNVESDAINAAEYLIRLNVKSSLPVCFIHQIYSIVNNHTVVDRELVGLQLEGIMYVHDSNICIIARSI